MDSWHTENTVNAERGRWINKDLPHLEDWSNRKEKSTKCNDRHYSKSFSCEWGARYPERTVEQGDVGAVTPHGVTLCSDKVMKMSPRKAPAEILSERGHNSGYPLWRALALVLVWTALLAWTKAQKFQVRRSLKSWFYFSFSKQFLRSGWDVAGFAKILNYTETNWTLFFSICGKVCNGKKQYGITASTGSLPIYSDQEFDPSAFSPHEEIRSFCLFTHTSNSGLSFSLPPCC